MMEKIPYPWRGEWQWYDEDYTGIEAGVKIGIEQGDAAKYGIYDLVITAHNIPAIDEVFARVADYAARHVVEHPHLYGLVRASPPTPKP